MPVSELKSPPAGMKDVKTPSLSNGSTNHAVNDVAMCRVRRVRWWRIFPLKKMKSEGKQELWSELYEAETASEHFGNFRGDLIGLGENVAYDSGRICACV